PALSCCGEELMGGVGVGAGDADSGRHVERLEDLARSRIDAPQIALVAFPGAVPELSIDPGDARDEPLALDRAENRPRLGIDLMDLPLPILAHPERAFGPREPRVTAAAARRDRREPAAGLRIDLPDATCGDLEQVPAIESRSAERSDVDRAQRLPARRIERGEIVSGGEPDLPTVVRDPVHVLDPREGSILSDDLGRR